MTLKMGEIDDLRNLLKDVRKRVKELEAEVAVSDKLLEEQYRVIDAIPECPVHGSRCVPDAVEWVNQVKTLGEIIVKLWGLNAE